MLLESSAMEEADIPGCLNLLVGLFLSGTWFSTQGLSDVVWSRRGITPSHTYADVSFNLVMAKVLRVNLGVLESNLVGIQWDGVRDTRVTYDNLTTTTADGVVWIDGCTFMFIVPKATDLVQDALQLMTVLYDTFSQHGMGLMFRLRGHRPRNAKMNLLMKVHLP